MVTNVLNQWSLPIYAVVVLLFVYGLIAKSAGDPWVWEKIQYLLDGMRARVYAGREQDRLDEHRITLFKRRAFVLRIRRPGAPWYWPYGKSCTPWAGWLVPVLRSGHTSQSTKSVFVAPRGDTSHEVDGVVGQAWSRNQSVIVGDLAEMTPNSSDAEIEEYSRRTFCDKAIVSKYFSQGRTPPRSIGAIPIEVQGKIWGALVLDSKDPDGVTDESINNFILTAGFVGQLLEKG